MNPFIKKISVTKDDLDQLNHVNNVRYVQWVQDIAETHWQLKTSVLMRSKYYWVLIEHTIAYKSPAVLGDSIRLETFVSQSEGVKSIRHVNMYNDSNNKLLVKSETTWCLMDAKSHRPMRITEDIAQLFN